MTTDLPRRRSSLVPIVISVGAALALGWRLADRAGWLDPEPDEALRCGGEGSPVDCFVRVPGGVSLLGAQADDPEAPGYDPAAGPHEGPVRAARVRDLWVMRSEATVGSYRRCVRAGACSLDELSTEGGYATWYPLDETDAWDRDRMPVNQVTWRGAASLCTFLGGRLPTGDEWEHVARAGDGRRWPWGAMERCPSVPVADDGFDRTPTKVDCEEDGPHPPGAQFSGHPHELLDLAGNLWEWTEDLWDPAGAADGPRVQRGGAWTSEDALAVRATVRGSMPPEVRLPDVGFRCVVGRRR